MNATKTSPKSKNDKIGIKNNTKQYGVAKGNHTIDVAGIIKVAWSKTEITIGESIDAEVETKGYKDGTAITFAFYEKNGKSAGIQRGSIKSKVTGNKAKVTWKYPEKLEPPLHIDASNGKVLIQFKIWTVDHMDNSNEIPVYSKLKIKVEKEDGTAIANLDTYLKDIGGVMKGKKTDGSGIATYEKLAPYIYKIKFTSGRIVPVGKTIANMSSAPMDIEVSAAENKVHVFKLIELFMYCGHKNDGSRRCACNTNVFEIVPDSTGKDAYSEDIMILSRIATSLTCAGKSLEKKENEFGMNAFLLKCEMDHNILVKFWEPDFWKGLKNPKEFSISGLSTPLTVKSFRPDLFKLQLQFPAFRKWSGGYKVGTEKSQFLNEMKNRRPITASSWAQTKEKTGWHLNKIPKPFTSEAPVVFSRNGVQVQLKFLEALGAVVELGNQINNILNLIQKNVPKVGWYFETETQFLQGTFVLEWGWKEYKDHRAYYYVGLNLDIKLIDLKLEIGVGLSGFSYKIQIFGSLTGSVSLSVKMSRISPDGDAEFGFPFGAEIIGTLGARAQAGCFVKIEGSVETGLKLDDGALKFSTNEGWSIGCKLKWTGITGKFKVSAGPAKKGGQEEQSNNEPGEHKEIVSSNHERELIGSKELGSWQWPNPKYEYKPSVIPRQDLHDMLLKKLTEGDNIRVKMESKFGINSYMEMKDVTMEIEKIIHSRNDIKRDSKTAEALIFEIRNRLEDIIHEKSSGLHFAHMEYSRFNNFLNSELKTKLDKYIDPMQEIINKNT
jgi:hypothetical protein